MLNLRHYFIVSGFLSWDFETSHVDLEKELQALTSQAPEGEEARNGKKCDVVHGHSISSQNYV
jgi:hypothetical protein